jgi:phage shock protein C
MVRPRKKFYINRSNKKLLGVCSGVADYLEVEAWIVRIVFLVLVLMGVWFLIPAYFVCYFLMDNNSGEFKTQVTSSTVFKHFRNVDYKKKLYRNTQDAKFLGVCAGIADYLEVDVTIVRIVTFVSFFVAGPIPWVAYFAAYFVLDQKNLLLTFRNKVTGDDAPEADGQHKHTGQDQESEQGEKFKQKDYSGRRQFQYCARKFSNLHDRLARMEAFVTSKQFKLHQQFKDLS